MFTIKQSYVVTDCSNAQTVTLLDSQSISTVVYKIDLNGIKKVNFGDIFYLVEAPKINLFKSGDSIQKQQFFLAKKAVEIFFKV